MHFALVGKGRSVSEDGVVLLSNGQKSKPREREQEQLLSEASPLDSRKDSESYTLAPKFMNEIGKASFANSTRTRGASECFESMRFLEELTEANRSKFNFRAEELQGSNQRVPTMDKPMFTLADSDKDSLAKLGSIPEERCEDQDHRLIVRSSSPDKSRLDLTSHSKVLCPGPKLVQTPQKQLPAPNKNPKLKLAKNCST